MLRFQSSMVMLSNESLNLKIHRGTWEIKDPKLKCIRGFTIKSYAEFVSGVYVLDKLVTGKVYHISKKDAILGYKT